MPKTNLLWLVGFSYTDEFRSPNHPQPLEVKEEKDVKIA